MGPNGTQVTINGSNLSNVSSVTIAGTAAVINTKFGKSDPGNGWSGGPGPRTDRCQHAGRYNRHEHTGYAQPHTDRKNLRMTNRKNYAVNKCIHPSSSHVTGGNKPNQRGGYLC
jgi:hypothetical protein